MSQDEDVADLAGPGLRTYQHIADAWHLSQWQRARLLGLDEATYAAVLVQPKALPEASLQRIGDVLGIYQVLHTLFPDPARADAWVGRPNTATGLMGRPALTRMLDDEGGLAWVRAYLGGVLAD